MCPASRPIALIVAALVTAAGGSAAAGELDAEVHDMTYLGFAHRPGSSQVFVRTNEPVTYSLDTARPDMVILTLSNTRVPVYNNTRTLPTQHFASPITRVEVRPIEGPSQSVRVEIHTRRRVTVVPQQKDRLLALDFAAQ